MAGFDVVYGIDFWKPACDTHEANGLGRTEKLDLLGFEAENVISLKEELQANYGCIDLVIGSPPCTEFSYAKKGGKGDLEKGMLLVRKHLLFVAVFKPKYWLMENVPRLKEVLDKECQSEDDDGWRISYQKLGLSPEQARSLGLEGNHLRIPFGRVFVATDFGTCENRKRFIAGNFPIHMMDAMKVEEGTDVSLGRILKRLEEGIRKSKATGLIEDPNYPGHLVKVEDLRDHGYNTDVHPMYWEEMRHLKRRHIQYGRMDLPDDLTAPGRTIMATYNASSRESILVDTGRSVKYQGRKRTIYKQPTVREVGCIQGFPLDFQLVAKSLGDRYKLIGNAVPCQLSYALARAIREDIRAYADRISDDDYRSRVSETLARADRARGPIVLSPTSVADEVEDKEDAYNEFRARPTKKFRRKVLSSKMENDSSVVVFENYELVGGKLVGGTHWKLCMQRGMGSEFARVYLDSTSVAKLLRSLKAPLDSSSLISAVRSVIAEGDKGMPYLADDWVEFPGYLNGGLERYLELIKKKRLQLPSVTLFQKAFTSSIDDLEGRVGPIDFFDSIDAIMLLVLSRPENKGAMGRFVAVSKLVDEGDYIHKLDPRIVPSIENANIPFVTIASALLSVHLLRKMYDLGDECKSDIYADSLRRADDLLVRECTID